VTVGATCCTISRSLIEVTEDPPGEVTRVSYCPAAIEAGRSMVRSVPSTNAKQLGWLAVAHAGRATVEPPPVGTRSTSVTPLVSGVGAGYEKFVPVTAMPVAPCCCGLATLATVGGSKYEYWSPGLTAPESTVTSTVPAASLGVSASIWLSDVGAWKHPAVDPGHGYTIEVTAVAPKDTLVAPRNPDPLIVTICSPPGPDAPVLGWTPVTVCERASGTFELRWPFRRTDEPNVLTKASAGRLAAAATEEPETAAVTARTLVTPAALAFRAVCATAGPDGAAAVETAIVSPASVAKNAPPNTSPRDLNTLASFRRRSPGPIVPGSAVES
jgi:hypothetical protein